MIETATARADNGVAIATRVGEALEEITAGTNKVNTLLQEIASASKEQADGVGQVNVGVTQLDAVTQQNAGNSEELASAAEETAAQASTMRELVGQFKISDRSGSPASSYAAPARRPSPRPSAAKTTAAPTADHADEIIPMDQEDLESF
jgi:methyl-accepting chemotaxis protein